MKKLFPFKMFLSALIIVGSILLTENVDAKTKITWWSESTEGVNEAVIAKLQNAFNASQDKYELEMVFKEDLDKVLRTAIQAGAAPDIIETPGPSYVKEYQEAGLIYSLQDAANKHGWKNLILPWAYNAGVFKGAFYSVPKTYETMVLLYNKTLFKEHGWNVPTNLVEFESLAKKIKAKGMFPMAYGSSGWNPTHEHLQGIYLNNYAGPENVYKALIGEKKWTDKEFVEAMALLKKHIVDEGYFSGSLENYYALGWDDFWAQFKGRKAAMMMIGTWGFRGAKDHFPNDQGDQWDWVPLPIFHTQAGKPNYQLALGTTLSVNSKAKDPQGAIAVLNFVLSNPERVISIAQEFNFGEWVVPLNFSEKDFGKEVDPRVKRFFIDFAQRTGKGDYGYTTWTFWPAEANTQLWKGIEEVWSSDISIEDFWKDHQKLWEKARKKKLTLPVAKR